VENGKCADVENISRLTKTKVEESRNIVKGKNVLNIKVIEI
jgi:hypothetical protein